jgi:hypothetical protein
MRKIMKHRFWTHLVEGRIAFIKTLLGAIDIVIQNQCGRYLS